MNTRIMCGVKAWEMTDKMPPENISLKHKARKYYVGIMSKVLPAGIWIILDSPKKEMVDRYWHRDEMILAMYDGFWVIGDYLYNQDTGCVIQISGEQENRQWFRPVDSTRLRGRAKRNYDYYVENLVLTHKI